MHLGWPCKFSWEQTFTTARSSPTHFIQQTNIGISLLTLWNLKSSLCYDRLSWCQASISICRLQFLLDLASAVILKSESRRTHDHILLSQIRHSPNPKGQVSVFISTKNRVTRLYPQGSGFRIRCLFTTWSLKLISVTYMSIHTSRETHCVSATETNQLMLSTEMFIVRITGNVYTVWIKWGLRWSRRYM
jgi:hypothetical protein